MGFIIGLVAKLIKIFLYFLIFFAFIVLIPNLPPYNTFTKIEHEATLPREGALAMNDALNNVQKLYENKLLGPEAFQVYDGELYTSLATGEIVKVSPGGHVTFVTKIGPPCTGLVQEHICGRPLGFKIDEKNKQLYVADTYLGIWKVDLKTDKKQLLVSPSVEVQGCKPKLFNDLVLDNEGNLYYTVSSCDFQLKDGSYTFLVDPSGRVLQYNAAKNKSTVLLDNLWFPNGIAISPANDYLLITETYGFKVIKYYIRGPKRGQKGTFISGLPGLPDNIRALPDGSGVLVALYSSFDDQDPLLIRTLGSVPIVRKFLARMQRLIEIPFEFLNEQFPHIMFEEIVYYIGSFKSISVFTPPTSGFLYVDWNGNVIASYYNSDSSVKHISDAIVYRDVLHLGNPHVQNFIAGSPVPTLLKNAFVSKKPNLVREEVNKVKDAPQLPTETVKPPKPTPTIAKASNIPQDKIHTTPKPEATKHTTPKPEATKHTTPKPEQKKDKAPKSEERNKETTPQQNNEKLPKQANSKPTIANEQPKSKTTVHHQQQQAETKTEKPKAEPKKDTSKQTDSKSTPPKQSETKPTPAKQADEKPKAAKQPENKPKLEKSETKETVKKEDKIAPLKQTPPPKQAEPKSAPPKQTESKTTTPKPAESKPTPSQQTESKSSPSKQTESKPTSSNKAESKSAPPKQADGKSKESIEKTKSKQKTKSDSESKQPIKKETTKPANTKPSPEQIPVKEDIKSDTAKPHKETIKVIKKEGPTEIPNLNP